MVADTIVSGLMCRVPACSGAGKKGGKRRGEYFQVGLPSSLNCVMGLEEDTLVIFTSDNGGFAGVSDWRPLREAKGYLYEGGIRVPLIVSWPGQVPKGKRCKTPVISMDFYPTFLELAALKPSGKPIDGESLLPLFRQSGKLSRQTIFFHFPNYAWHMGNKLAGAVR